MNEKSRQAKAEFKRRYGEARKHLIQFGYVQENGKSRIEAGELYQRPYIFTILGDYFTMVTGKDYRQLIRALADKEARLIDDDVRPDATAAAMIAIVRRRNHHFRTLCIDSSSKSLEH